MANPGQSEVFDMRHFRAWSHQVIRPVTVQAVNFVTALVQGQANENNLLQHSLRIETGRAANMGKVFDRHLMMLEYIAQNSVALKRISSQNTKARENFLSTSTLGSAGGCS